jgi:hypothetical protein
METPILTLAACSPKKSFLRKAVNEVELQQQPGRAF